MADNMSIRVSDDVRERFNELAKIGDFDNKGEFLDQLLLVYQSEMTKRETPILKEAIAASQAFMWRLMEIFQGVSAAIVIERENSEKEAESQKSKFNDIRSLMEQRINNLQNELSESEIRADGILSDKQILEGKAAALEERAEQADKSRIQQEKQIEESISDKNTLIEELKSKISSLNEVIISLKEAENENSVLKTTIETLKQERANLKGQVEEAQYKNIRQTENFSAEKEALLKEAQLQKGTEILELRQANHNQLEEYQRKHNESIAAYEEKIRDLWNLLENERKETK